MLSFEGFKHHIGSIKHETNMYNTYKHDVCLKSIENSEKVLIDNFTKQQKMIERYEKALKRIAYDEEVIFEQTEVIAKRALGEKENY